MNIYEHFKDYNDKFYDMKDKMIAIKEAEKNFITLTGSRPNDMPKTNKNNNFDFSDQLARIEKMITSYKKIEKDYLKLREKHLKEISNVTKAKYRTILKLFFIEGKSLKTSTSILNKTYKLDYTIDYVKNLKSKAIKEFEKVTFCYKK